MSAHTNGPWTMETVRTSSGICHKIGPFPWKEGKQNHACIYADFPGNGAPEAELFANARLIAASPDLLEALVECERVLSDLPSTVLRNTRTGAAYKTARAAIAKATGAAS